MKELREAASALYNLTIGDPEVIVRPRSYEKRDAIIAAAARLRAAIEAPEQPTILADYEEVLTDHRRLCRELGRLLIGEGAPAQPSLCDLVSFVRREGVTLAGKK